MQGAPKMPLGPGESNEEMQKRLCALTVERLFAYNDIVDQQMAQCCVAGILLKYNELDASHVFSQKIKTVEGSYWHGIMHRREPDFGNAKYWFRQVGKHAVEKELVVKARELANASEAGMASGFLREQEVWDHDAFIDFCETVIDSGSESEKLAEEIQEVEWQLLFNHCFKKATGT